EVLGSDGRERDLCAPRAPAAERRGRLLEGRRGPADLPAQLCLGSHARPWMAATLARRCSLSGAEPALPVGAANLSGGPGRAGANHRVSGFVTGLPAVRG